MALGTFRKTLAAAVKDCKTKAEVSQLREFFLRECTAECDKKVNYYQTRKATLDKEYKINRKGLEDEYKEAVNEVNRSLGVRPNASSQPPVAPTSQAKPTEDKDKSKSKSGDKDGETHAEKFLRKAGYTETAAKGEITTNEKTHHKLLKIHKKFLQSGVYKDSLKQSYENAGLSEKEVRLAIDMHKHITLWHMGSKTIPAMGTLPLEFCKALSRDRMVRADEGKGDSSKFQAKALLYRDYLSLMHCEKLRQFVCKSSGLLQSKDEVLQDVIRVVKFLTSETKSLWTKAKKKSAYKNKTMDSIFPGSINSLCSSRNNRFFCNMFHIKKRAVFTDFLKNGYRDQRPRFQRSSTSLKRKRDDKDRAYFGLSTVTQVKQKKQKLDAALESDFEGRASYLVNEILRAKQERTDQERIVKRETGAIGKAEMRANWQAPWVADLDQLIVDL